MRKTATLATASLVAASLAAATAPAFAQQTQQTAQASGARCTNTVTGRDQTLCFEGETVSGGVVGPDGQDVRTLHARHGGSLLQLRAHFLPEMLHSVENL